jgi:glycosyltransferase involved in cell wall biosynthesis
MLVSVCLPVFNGQAHLKSAVESVLAQTFGDFELLIADDGSTDQSYSIACELANTDKRVIAWKNPARQGLFGNYNACLAKAEGVLIKPFAQDDLLKPEALASMVDILKDESIALVACARQMLTTGSVAQQKRHERLQSGVHAGEDVILSCLREYRNLIGEPVAVMYKAAYKGQGFNTDYHSLGDIEYWIRILEEGKLYYLDRELVSFRRHENSTTDKLLENMNWVLDFFKLGKDYKHYLSRLDVSYEDYFAHFAELAGGLIEEMVCENGLEIENLDGFKEVAYYALVRCGQLAHKGREYDLMVNSASWRYTKPLRNIRARLPKNK